MTTPAHATAEERAMEARYQARLDREAARLRDQAQRAVEDFKRSFPPPSDQQIERLLYPELSEFQVEVGGRKFTLRELPATVEKKFLRLIEQKLPALLEELSSLEERLTEEAERGFARLLGRAAEAMDLVADACVLVLDPLGEQGVTPAFVQQFASTARQTRILQAQLLLNGGRDFLSRLFPALKDAPLTEGPARSAASGPAGAAASSPTPGSPPPSVGSSSSAARPVKLEDSSPWDNSL